MQCRKEKKKLYKYWKGRQKKHATKNQAPNESQVVKKWSKMLRAEKQKTKKKENENCDPNEKKTKNAGRRAGERAVKTKK